MMKVVESRELSVVQLMHGITNEYEFETTYSNIMLHVTSNH